MPLPAIAAGISAASSLLASKKQSDAAKDYANLVKQQQGQTRRDLQPYTQLGQSGINSINRLYGFAPVDPNANINQSPFSRSEFDEISRLWPTIRGAAQFDDISAQHRPNLSPEAESFLRSNFGAIRGANSFGDVDFGASTGYVPPAPEAGAPDMSGFFTSPDYQFRRDEGTRGIENRFSARGGVQSGNALRALNEFNSGLASGEFNNYINRQLGFAGVGQNAANTVVGAGERSARGVGQAGLQEADARASGLAGANNAVTGYFQNRLLDKYLRNDPFGQPQGQQNQIAQQQPFVPRGYQFPTIIGGR